ncbi:MAG: hypothetical protein KDK78_09520, partial [Chlamydiia bacterium]|nr:hypothetical protein [Chlamydiia bacterium]
MYFIKKSLFGLSACALSLFLMAAAPAQADTVPVLDPGTYQLHNHPDGNQAPPSYGLRLDELMNVSGGHDVFTFDFDHALSDVRMDLTATSAHIYGTVFGGLDVGSAYSPGLSGLWAIDFLYNDLTSLLPSDDDYSHGTSNDSGTITQLFGAGIVKTLNSYMGFRLGDTDNDLGYRGFAGISGWGWLSYGSKHIDSSDWLFTVGDRVNVPEPQTYLT